MNTTARWAFVYGAGLVTAMLLELVFGGPETLLPGRILNALLEDHAEGSLGASDRIVLTEIRIPRAVLGALVGGSLAVAGVLMQGLFRNPLASPGILGATAGGAFGAVFAVAAGLTELSIYSTPIAAFVGTLFALFVVTLMAASRFHLSIPHLLLCGIAVNTLFSAGTSLMLTFSADYYYVSRQIIDWLTGSLVTNPAGARLMPVVVPSFFVLVAVSALLGRDLNLLLMGEDSARSLGVPMQRIRVAVLILASLLTGLAVAIAGMVGFIGLVAPHVVRLLQGPDHRGLLVSAPLFGGAFLLVCDVVAQNAIPPDEIQLGIITSLIGGPFFLCLLLRDRKSA